MRIGEVPKITPNDINERKLTLRDPKSGKGREFVFISEKVSERLKDYVKENSFKADQKIFPICYEAARAMVKKAGNQVGIKLRPQDLWSHTATHASRFDLPVPFSAIKVRFGKPIMISDDNIDQAYGEITKAFRVRISIQYFNTHLAIHHSGWLTATADLNRYVS